MTLKLEIRAPIFVLVADFNPAIFTMPWIAKHLLGREEGDELTVTEVVIQTGSQIVQLGFFEGVAFNVAQSRTEIFALDAEAETLARVEEVLLKMLTTLPHTPLRAVGCNLNYVDDDPQEAIVGLFKTAEGFEGEGVLNVRQSGIQLQLDAESVLNFTRVLTASDARFSFNYHRAETDVERYKEFLPGFIANSIERSGAILKSMYGYEGHEVVGFMPEVEGRDEIGEVEAAN
jgi:hypothetical protein